MDVMAELKSIGTLFTEGNFVDGSQSLQALWSKIPDPKTEIPNTYLVIEYGVAFALKLRKLDDAQAWADKAAGFQEVRQDMGEVEFLVGKVAFERGDYDAAKRNFILAYNKSEGRAFRGKDPKYKKLID